MAEFAGCDAYATRPGPDCADSPTGCGTAYFPSNGEAPVGSPACSDGFDNDCDGATAGANAWRGSDADRVFGGIVAGHGLFSNGLGATVLSLAGLDPAKAYDLVVFSNRDQWSWWTHRHITTTLSGADAQVVLTLTSAEGQPYANALRVEQYPP